MKITIEGAEFKMECNGTTVMQANAWELRCAELEQELRDAQAQLNESVRKEARLELEAKELRDRIVDQDLTIAKYDDENRRLKEHLKKIVTTPFMDGLNDWAKKIHDNAVKHGWWTGGVLDGDCCGIYEDVDRPFPEIVALCHSELSEALEEYRNGMPLEYQVLKIPTDNQDPHRESNYRDVPLTNPKEWMAGAKPEGIAVEMIDCIIRILDWCGKEGIDVDAVLRRKHEYNKSRPYRHGGKKA